MKQSKLQQTNANASFDTRLPLLRAKHGYGEEKKKLVNEYKSINTSINYITMLTFEGQFPEEAVKLAKFKQEQLAIERRLSEICNVTG